MQPLHTIRHELTSLGATLLVFVYESNLGHALEIDGKRSRVHASDVPTLLALEAAKRSAP